MSPAFVIVLYNKRRNMANIHDPSSWVKFDDRTKLALSKIKELFIDSVDRCDSCKEANCICEADI